MCDKLVGLPNYLKSLANKWVGLADIYKFSW